jgi:hypothetical protein
MRRFALVLLASLLLAPAAFADRRVAGDGTLAVSGASARVIVVKGSGLIFGHIDQGTLTVLSYDAAGTSAPQITGATARIVANVVVYSGTDIRFLFPNGHYSLRFEGTGIDISAIGRGNVAAFGLGTTRDGTLSVDGGDPQAVTIFGVSARFGNGNAAVNTKVPGVPALVESQGLAKGSSPR